jgi:hypothetical protein
MSEEVKEQGGLNIPERKVITVDLSEIEVHSQLKRLILDKITKDEDRKNIENLKAYIEEAGIEVELNFTDARMVKVWYALLMKYEDAFGTPSAGATQEDWVLLYEYLKDFTPSTNEYYHSLIDMIQLSIVKYWGSNMPEKSELTLTEEKALDSHVNYIFHLEEVKEILPKWYVEYIDEMDTESLVSPIDVKMKELYKHLKAA